MYYFVFFFCVYSFFFFLSSGAVGVAATQMALAAGLRVFGTAGRDQIGRASCREKGENSVGAVSLKKKECIILFFFFVFIVFFFSYLAAPSALLRRRWRSRPDYEYSARRAVIRSEERRVGKRGRTRWARYH